MNRANQSIDSFDGRASSGSTVKHANLVIDTASLLIDINSTKMLDKLAVEAIEKREQEYCMKIARVNESNRSNSTFGREIEKVWKRDRFER